MAVLRSWCIRGMATVSFDVFLPLLVHSLEGLVVVSDFLVDFLTVPVVIGQGCPFRLTAISAFLTMPLLDHSGPAPR